MTRGSDDPSPDDIQLEELTLDAPVKLDEPDVVDRSRPIQERVALILSLVLIAWLVFALDRWDHRPPTTVFPDRTGQVLIFQDNRLGSSSRGAELWGAVSIVDLDHRVVVRRYLRGNSPGDQPYFLLRLADSVAYGAGDIFAAPLDGSAPKKVMSGRTVSIVHPAAEPGHVLVLSYPHEYFRGVPTIREFATPRRIIRTTKGMPADGDAFPARGVPGGMTYDTSHGVVLWNFRRQRVTQRFGRTQATVAAGRRDLLVWCEGDCREAHMTRIGGRDRIVHPPRGTTFPMGSVVARVSPDGRWLAVIAGRSNAEAGPGWIGSHVVLVDTRTGRSRVVYRGPSCVPTDSCDTVFTSAPTWSTDSRRLFFVDFSQGTDDVRIGEYVLASREVHKASIPVPGAFGPVAVDASHARGFVQAWIEDRCVQTDLSFDDLICAERF